MSDVPLSLAALSPEWIGTALRDAGHDHGGIDDVTVIPMPGIVGALGEVGVVEVTYKGAPELPSTFVAKCPLDSDIARLYNQIMQSFVRESGFYRDLASEVRMRIPRCYVNATDGADRYLMLIEHVRGAEDGDILHGTSVDNMRKLVADLGSMHGQFWMDPRLPQLPWAVDWSAASYEMGIPLVENTWAALNEREPDLIPTELRATCERAWLADPRAALAKFNARPWTFTHGDYELDNMLFTDDDIVVLDWQMAGKSFPGHDLAFLLCASSSPETIAAEPELLDVYRQALAAAGGPSWSRDDLLDDLATSMLFWVVGQSVTALSDTSDYGEKAERMQRRFRKFMESAIDGAMRWDTPGRVARRF